MALRQRVTRGNYAYRGFTFRSTLNTASRFVTARDEATTAAGES
jgi:hypothetical protein